MKRFFFIFSFLIFSELCRGQAVVQITNEGSTIGISLDGIKSFIPKNGLRIERIGNSFVRLVDIQSKTYELPYSKITIPSSDSIADLCSQINSYVIPGGSLWQNLSIEGKGFTAITDLIVMTTAFSRYDLFYMKNVSPEKFVRFKEFIFAQALVAAGTPQVGFYVYASPTVSANGTALTIRKVLATGTINSEMEVYKSPTVTSVGTLVNYFQVGEGAYVRDQELSRYLTPGNTVLISALGDQNGIIANFIAVWAEQEQ